VTLARACPAKEVEAPMRSEIKGSSTQVPAHSSAHSSSPSPAAIPAQAPARSRPTGNAFSPRFLEAAQGRDRALRKAAEGAGGDEVAEADGRALCAGPFEVEEVEPVVDHSLGRPGGRAFAVVRRARSLAEGGGTVAVCASYADALHLAAVVPAVGAANHLWLAPERPRGLPLHDGRRFLGHVNLARRGEGPAALSVLPHYLHVARHFAANPEALALLHRSLSAEALALLGRRLMGWMA